MPSSNALLWLEEVLQAVSPVPVFRIPHTTLNGESKIEANVKSDLPSCQLQVTISRYFGLKGRVTGSCKMAFYVY